MEILLTICIIIFLMFSHYMIYNLGKDNGAIEALEEAQVEALKEIHEAFERIKKGENKCE